MSGASTQEIFVPAARRPPILMRPEHIYTQNHSNFCENAHKSYPPTTAPHNRPLTLLQYALPRLIFNYVLLVSISFLLLLLCNHVKNLLKFNWLARIVEMLVSLYEYKSNKTEKNWGGWHMTSVFLLVPCIVLMYMSLECHLLCSASAVGVSKIWTTRSKKFWNNCIIAGWMNWKSLNAIRSLFSHIFWIH